jgi:transcriptional regulator with XRE-family HTH domain
MASKSSLPLPALRSLQKVGRELALARRKRGLSTRDMASRLFVSRDTLWRLERGDPSVAIGTLATAAFLLQVHGRLADLFAPGSDTVGLDLDEVRVKQRIHRPRRVTP